MDIAVTAAIPYLYHTAAGYRCGGTFLITFGMGKDDKEETDAARRLAAKNMRLAIILGLVALAFYAGFILLYAK